MRHTSYVVAISTIILGSLFWYQSNSVVIDIQTAMDKNFNKLIVAINNPTPSTSHASKTPDKSKQNVAFQ